MLLDGLRVLELSHAVAGPTASQILGDLGAEVLKIERPEGGDIFRDTPGMGPSMFLAVNRGKKSVALDLKKPEGLRIFFQLLKKCDVLVENLSPGASEKLGINPWKVRRANPKIIHCMVESFGKGPSENTPAFDPVLQAAVGIMSTTGFSPDRYARAGVSIVDMSTGMHAAIAVLASLYERQKTGRGSLIEVPLYDAAAYYMSYWVARYDLTKKDTKPLGSTHIFGAPYNLFRTADGWVYISVANDEAWKELCESLGYLDLLSKKEYKTSSSRVKHKLELENIVQERLEKLKTDSILGKLSGSKVPVSRFNTAKSLLNDPHFLARGLLEQYTFGGKPFRTIVNPALFDDKRVHAKSSPPKLGEHTKTVLHELLGLEKERLDLLESSGVIAVIRKK